MLRDLGVCEECARLWFPRFEWFRRSVVAHGIICPHPECRRKHRGGWLNLQDLIPIGLYSPIKCIVREARSPEYPVVSHALMDRPWISQDTKPICGTGVAWSQVAADRRAQMEALERFSILFRTRRYAKLKLKDSTLSQWRPTCTTSGLGDFASCRSKILSSAVHRNSSTCLKLARNEWLERWLIRHIGTVDLNEVTLHRTILSPRATMLIERLLKNGSQVMLYGSYIPRCRTWICFATHIPQSNRPANGRIAVGSKAAESRVAAFEGALLEMYASGFCRYSQRESRSLLSALKKLSLAIVLRHSGSFCIPVSEFELPLPIQTLFVHDFGNSLLDALRLTCMSCS